MPVPSSLFALPLPGGDSRLRLRLCRGVGEESDNLGHSQRRDADAGDRVRIGAPNTVRSRGDHAVVMGGAAWRARSSVATAAFTASELIAMLTAQ